MTTELQVLAWGCVLGIAHILIAAQAATAQYGAKWGFSSREGDVPPARPLVGRLQRAQRNYFETFPLAAAAILIVSVAGIGTHWTAGRCPGLDRGARRLFPGLRGRHPGRPYAAVSARGRRYRDGAVAGADLATSPHGRTDRGRLAAVLK